MVSTINKIQILEKYISRNQSVNNIISSTITKLLERETKRMQDLFHSLKFQLKSFEKQYLMNSKDFVKEFEKGNLGDDIDFIEWSATFDMFINAKKSLEILNGK
ncbi:MAG: hypothetical protein B6I24_02415 [Bacteroidetes bacterium 4572_128]|nr:MAG: hypothetical protein B6I24_02415 [Bacteroidetes bacterium 4572_128]